MKVDINSSHTMWRTGDMFLYEDKLFVVTSTLDGSSMSTVRLNTDEHVGITQIFNIPDPSLQRIEHIRAEV